MFGWDTSRPVSTGERGGSARIPDKIGNWTGLGEATLGRGDGESCLGEVRPD